MSDRAGPELKMGDMPPPQDDDTQEKSGVLSIFKTLQARLESIFYVTDELPLSRHIILISIASLFFFFIVWASFATLDEVTRGDGRIIPSSEVKMVQNLEGGIVKEFLVREGEKVDKGDILMRLDDISAGADYDRNSEQYYGLKAAIARLEALITGLDTPKFSEELRKAAPAAIAEELLSFNAQQKDLNSQRTVLEQQLKQREQDIIQIKSRIEDVTTIMELAEEERALIEPLVERGSAPQVELIRLKRATVEHRAELNQLKNSLPRAQQAVAEAEAKLNGLIAAHKAQAQTELADKKLEVRALESVLGALADRQSRTEIRSPVSGIIKDIKIHTVGGVVQPGADLIEIVPVEDQLLVEAKVRPGDIAFLHPGQKAVVKVTAYDYAIYGGLKAELVDISADTLTNERGDAFFRVRLRTEDNVLKRNGQIYPIIPGMVASVDILTGEKTVMEYLLKPIVKTLDNAMHER